MAIPRFKVITDHPLALNSPDYYTTIDPEMIAGGHGGAIKDNSRNLVFNQKLKNLYPQGYSLLDYGCSGGAFVEDCVRSGNVAIGLEGTEYSKKIKRDSWRTIPKNLFVCDVSQPFQVKLGKEDYCFDIITAWEFIEHIAPQDLPMLCENTRKHLKKNGVWIMSVSMNEAPTHLTQQTAVWWNTFFLSQGFSQNRGLWAYLRNGNSWVRSDPGSFHLVLKML